MVGVVLNPSLLQLNEHGALAQYYIPLTPPVSLPQYILFLAVQCLYLMFNLKKAESYVVFLNCCRAQSPWSEETMYRYCS